MNRRMRTSRNLSLPRFAVRRDEAAAAVAVSATKFDEWVADGRMPKGRKIDGVVLWDVGELWASWLDLRDGVTIKNPFDKVTA